jgi:hypothetical protein
MTAYIHREIGRTVERALRVMPVVVITGMRQTGKTTFLENSPLLKGFRYYTLDDFGTLSAARNDPESLIASADRICIDEAQKAPELFTAIKKAVDRSRKPGRFVLSGSANFALLKQISESLAGRAVYLTLAPFSRREILQSTSDLPLLVRMLTQKRMPRVEEGEPVRVAEILKGGMPPALELDADEQATWFRGFEQTYVERDIRDIARIDDLIGFRNLVRLAALRSGQLLNLSQLARDGRLSLATTTRYVQLAETSFLFKRLDPYLRNRSSRLIKSPKLYLTDSGIAGHLMEADNLEATAHDPSRGVLFETYVYQNLSAFLETHLPDARLSYWHVQGRHEVDFIIEHKRKVIAVEVKSAARWSESDLTSLKTFISQTPNCVAGILGYNGEQVAAIGKSIWAVPLGTLVQ